MNLHYLFSIGVSLIPPLLPDPPKTDSSSFAMFAIRSLSTSSGSHKKNGKLAASYKGMIWIIGLQRMRYRFVE